MVDHYKVRSVKIYVVRSLILCNTLTKVYKCALLLIDRTKLMFMIRVDLTKITTMSQFRLWFCRVSLI